MRSAVACRSQKGISGSRRLMGNQVGKMLFLENVAIVAVESQATSK